VGATLIPMTHAPFVTALGGRFSCTTGGQVAMILELACHHSWSKPVLVACDDQYRLVSGFSSSFARSETSLFCLQPVLIRPVLACLRGPAPAITGSLRQAISVPVWGIPVRLDWCPWLDWCLWWHSQVPLPPV
jgi:hypothetical protein